MLNDSITKQELVSRIDQLDSIMGFDRVEHGENDGTKPRKGWLINMHGTTIPSDNYLAGYSGVDYYFLGEDGGSFKATLQFDPYFFLMCLPGHEAEVEEWLRRELEAAHVKNITRELKDDLALPNHLVGLQRLLIKVSFHNVSDLLTGRRILSPIIKQNQLKRDTRDIYLIMNFNNMNNETGAATSASATSTMMSESFNDPSTYIDDIREYDVPYHVRVSIDKNIRVGKWYDVYVRHSVTSFVEDSSRIAFADPVVLAFDIETTKAPLKFPDAKIDQIMMISYMIDGEGFLITNREIISQDIDDFEYTPKPEYPGLFTIFNEPDEKRLLMRFFEHIRDVRPTVIATFNGDFFDWPFVENRTRYHDMDMFEEIGFAKDNEGEYKSKYCVHMDCFRWVKRDSYLPQGSQGLKAVTTAKLGYNPTELDPELMTPYAYEHPQLLSEYSVSDAVATYYLYFKYVHPFIFSLCTIIPLSPDEVLRKGTGTLCEMLLMVQAYEKGILLPNKHSDPIERFYEGHLLESETYVGGHVESLEAGVFRSDIANDFRIDPKACDELISELHDSIKFCIEVENGKKVSDVENYQEVYDEIKGQLEALRDQPNRRENPLIYHVDVASMYPNIMTSNRLQPDSMKTEEDCAACDFNRPGKNCDRRLEWAWRGEYFPTEMNEYSMIKRSLQNDKFPPSRPWLPQRTFDELSYTEQASHIKKRLGDYSRKVYHRIKQTTTIKREAIICQRENPFYVNTVRSFRDRRYEFKTLAKVWKGKASKLGNDVHAKDEAKKMIILYDSLQLAHKVILNSFYGYVMRKGSRWYSMEMAGITCLTGATIIQMARSLVERLGRPLELDTDGIWCILPTSFPENFHLKCKDGKKIFLEYPCSMLNFRVHQKFTNHQYQDLVDNDTFKYTTKSDNSIFFEVDGPYKAMILPTSKEEGKGLKKRYAVFNDDGSLAELKGFELKRRGELQLIKNFQSDIFKLFLEGDTLDNCYKAVASVANNWLDVLDTKGGMLEDEDLIELICENRSMSKSLQEYGTQKSTSITTAKRLGEFLGEEMVKDAGLACKYIISAKPIGSPVTERAIPVSIFSSDKKEMFLKKWLKDPSLTDFDPRSVIDWSYYHERLSSVVQKIITIPAALQGVKNPVPRVVHPDWLKRKIAVREDSKQQSHISSFFNAITTKSERAIKDIEDFNNEFDSNMKPKIARVTTRKRKNAKLHDTETAEEEAYHTAILNGPCPSMFEDYSGFLEYQKAKWSLQEKNRLQRRRLFGENTEGTHRSTVGNMMRRQAESISGSNWEILQYTSSGKPGEIKVFVNIDDKIHTFIFHIPKKIYGSFKTELSLKRTIQNCQIDNSNAILPNGHDGTWLYKFTMPETVYQEELNKVGGLLQDPNVIGLYETQVDSIARAVIELGNTISFDDTRVGSLGKGLKNGFNFKDLQRVQLPNDNKYMAKFRMDIIYILHLVVNGYEIYVIFKTWEQDGRIFILKPNTNAQEILSNINKVYEESYMVKKKKVSTKIIAYQSSIEFETTYHTEEAKLFKHLNQYINKIQSEGRRGNKCLLAIQSTTISKILNGCNACSGFPLIKMNGKELSLPPVGWQQLISKRVVNHYFVLGSWIENLISLARYGNIPLCNLEVDNMGHLIDIEYSRRLIDNNIVLWWSPNPLPDLGGIENDSLPDYDSLNFPIINNPEIYESACLEIDIGTLTINTILTSSLINEAEGAELADDIIVGDKSNGGSTIAEDFFSVPALNTLRSMVKKWWDDALKGSNNADSMMNNLVTWVQRRDSYLYSFALHYHVHNLTVKSLLQLIGEFKKMNAMVIFANRNKLLVKTTKVSVENSYAYGQYLLKAARSKPMFNFLDLTISRYWDILIWMDEYNYGGRCCYAITSNEVQDLEPVNQWQLKNYLPILYQNEFEDWLVIFLDSITKMKNESLSSTTNGTQRITQIQHILNGQRKLENNTDISNDGPDAEHSVIEIFRGPFEKRIKRLYKRQIESILNPEMKEEYTFPQLPGSYLSMKNPTLELVKFLCAIFGLSTKRTIETRMLRKDLLALFEVKEFSPEAQFKYPSTSLKVPHVICDYCNYIRDLDFCRDEPELLWSCKNCQRPYHRVSLEEELIGQYQKLIVRFLHQDLVCSKCKLVRADNMSEFCKCSGPWTETVNYLEVEKKIQTFTNVAKAYKLELLQGVLTE